MTTITPTTVTPTIVTPQLSGGTATFASSIGNVPSPAPAASSDNTDTQPAPPQTAVPTNANTDATAGAYNVVAAASTPTIRGISVDLSA